MEDEKLSMTRISSHPRFGLVFAVSVIGCVISLAAGCQRREQAATSPPPEIVYPLDETIFPPDIAAPRFRWKSTSEDIETWLVTIGGEEAGTKVTARVDTTDWTPTEEQWSAIQQLEKSVKVSVRDAEATGSAAAASSAEISISTSADEVGAPLFYREVNLPFVDAVKDPTNIRWRFGPISSAEPPPIVLEKLPVCGNCHSFSADGSVFGMDVDYANDKGSYVIANVAEKVFLDRDSIITWAEYARDDGDLTFGLLSQISPNGRYVVSTVKDRSVFVPMPDLAFSQLFFPVKGILVAYDRQEKTFSALSGADDRAYVQSNPTWSPDGEHIVFAKSKAHQLKNVGDKILLRPEDCREFIEGGKTFLFDLYRVPFNGGKGGRAVPLEGASDNGMSNYFPRYSPDGRWIVFTKAKSFMLLQPDSELYIMPAEGGGEPRKMRCNTPRMNSWHSWSPNSKWLVFSAKPDGPYTQLFLTHIDEEGRSSPPVLLDRLVSPERAANIPEFVNASPSAIKRIHEQFVDEVSYMRAGNEFLKGNAPEAAERAYRRALKINPNHVDSLNNLGYLLMHTNRPDEARSSFEKVIAAQPDSIEANNNLGFLLIKLGSFGEGRDHLRKFLELRPENFAAHSNLGYALQQLGDLEKARAHYEKSIELEPEYTTAHCNLGELLQGEGEFDAARPHVEKCHAP